MAFSGSRWRVVAGHGRFAAFRDLPRSAESTEWTRDGRVIARSVVASGTSLNKPRLVQVSALTNRPCGLRPQFHGVYTTARWLQQPSTFAISEAIVETAQRARLHQ